MKQTIKVPLALKELIQTSNELLLTYKKELEERIENSNIDMMYTIGLNPTEWALDMDTMMYVQIDPPDVNDNSPEKYESEL